MTKEVHMGQYVILIYEDESRYEQGGEAAWSSALDSHNRFGTANAAALRGGSALQPTATATTVRAGGSGFVVTDGPFAETKEALGGFYVVEADDLDHALEIAKQVPAPFGGVEVRPVVELD